MLHAHQCTVHEVGSIDTEINVRQEVRCDNIRHQDDLVIHPGLVEAHAPVQHHHDRLEWDFYRGVVELTRGHDGGGVLLPICG